MWVPALGKNDELMILVMMKVIKGVGEANYGVVNELYGGMVIGN